MSPDDPRTCLDCGIPVRPQRRRDDPPLTRRQRRRLRGVSRVYHGRGLCATCYHRRRRADTLIEAERPTLTNAELLEEWHHFPKPDADSHAELIRQFAAHLGRNHAGVEKALHRAGIYAPKSRRWVA